MNTNHRLPKIFYLILALVFGISVNLTFFPSKADAGSPVLQSIVDDINKKCKNINKNSDTWKECEKKQQQLQAIAGCSGQMFVEKNGKWSPAKEAVSECQDNINDGEAIAKRSNKLIKFIRDKCKDVSDKRGVVDSGTFLVGITVPIGLISTLALSTDTVNLQGNWDNCEGSQNTLKILGSQCDSLFERVDGGGIGTLYDKNWGFKDGQLRECQKLVDKQKDAKKTNAGDGVSADSSDPDGKPAADCDTELSSPLSWIMCPLIDLGAKATDAIFDQVIKPLLSDIPLTTDNKGENTGLYNAWNSFRFLANIMIIGSMLMIVYAQARGDK